MSGAPTLPLVGSRSVRRAYGRQFADASPIALGERQPFRSRPALKPPLSCECFIPSREQLREYERDGHPLCRVAAVVACPMGGEARIKVFSVANIDRPICTAEHVNVKRHFEASSLRSSYEALRMIGKNHLAPPYRLLAVSWGHSYHERSHKNSPNDGGRPTGGLRFPWNEEPST